LKIKEAVWREDEKLFETDR